jgi:HSP20 family protein
MSDPCFSTGLFGEIDRLQQQMASVFGGFPISLRAARLGAFPQINIGSTDDTIEIVAFAPGLDPAQFDVSIDKGLLIISGERKNLERSRNDEVRSYVQERFSCSFKRVIELPQQADPDKVQARYKNGCLKISVGKLEASKPRAIAVQ